MDKCDKCVNFGEPQLRYIIGENSAFDYQIVVCRDCGTKRRILEITREDGKKFKGEVAELSIRIDVGNIEE